MKTKLIRADRIEIGDIIVKKGRNCIVTDVSSHEDAGLKMILICVDGSYSGASFLPDDLVRTNNTCEKVNDYPACQAC